MKKLLCLFLCFCIAGCSTVKVEPSKKSEEEVIEKDEDTTDSSSVTPDPTTTSDISGQAAITNPEITSSGVTLSSASRTVIIDAGHGGIDSGATNGNLYEKDITLTYALAIGQYLSEQDVNVIYTRTGDYELAQSSYTYNGVSYTNDLTARAALPYQYNAAIYCSIHIDSNDANSHGFSCFYNPKYADSLDLANRILSNLSAIGYTNNRGLLDGTRLRSIRGNTTIAVMAELGFIQSSDIDYIFNHVDIISAAIGNAIMQKLSAGWISPDTTVVPDLS